MPKILIADDSIAVRKVAERLLTEAGMVVSLAANGSEALALLGRECPDVIVSDVIMPDKSGYEVCSFVRAQSNLAAIPVLLISGIVNDDVTKQAEACHADGVLKKPFQGTSLKDRVQELLTRRAAKLDVSPVADEGSQNEPAGIVAPLSPPDGPPHLPVQLAIRSVMPATAAPAPSTRTSLASVASDIESSMSQDSAAVRIRELEATLASERERSAQLTTQVKESESLVARVRELESTLAQERAEREVQQHSLTTTVEQLRGHNDALTGRVADLNNMLADERRRSHELVEKTGGIEQLSARLESAESRLAAEQEALQALTLKSAEDGRKAARVVELEASLRAERDAAIQLVQQIAALEKLEQRVKDLEARLATERGTSADLLATIATLQEQAGRVQEIDVALARERERSAEFEAALTSQRQQAAILAQQAGELERAANRVQELDGVLARERERSTQLAKRAIEAEQLAEQSSRRLEDMTKKLTEIVGLASQMGNATH